VKSEKICVHLWKKATPSEGKNRLAEPSATAVDIKTHLTKPTCSQGRAVLLLG
jgi:hypothetical protein